MFVAAGVAWYSLPEHIPIPVKANNFSLGQEYRYGGKFEGLMPLPLLALGTYLLLLFVPKIVPRRTTPPPLVTAGQIFLIIRILVLVILNVIYFSILHGIVIHS